MTTAVKTQAPVLAGVRGGGRALAGAGTLIRFILRRDRVRLPVWLGATTLFTVMSAASFQQNYPEASDRQIIAESMNSPAGLVMTGPVRYLEVPEYTFGAMLGHQVSAYVAVVAALMSVLLLVRHTRTEEETGRAELVRASVVGRHAHLAAALIVAVAANLGLGLLLALGLGGLGLAGVTWGGSLLFGLATAAVGIVFAAVAAVTVQITEYPRGASGMAFAVLGCAFALRAAGDVGTDALSWLSPIGWAQRTYVYVDDRWWPLLIAVVVAGLLALAAFGLSTRRDVGAGLRPPRLGRPGGSRGLTTPFGFALRLHRGLLIGFGVGALLMGMMYGSIMGDVEEMVANIAALREMMAQIGGASIVDSFASVVMVVLASVCAVYVVLAALRPRGEENAGRAEPVLATALPRPHWVASHVAVALAGGTGVLLAAGIGLGISAAASTGDAGRFLTLLGAALAYAPALWVTAGVAVALYGWLPRLAALVWVIPVYGFVVGYLGELFGFPSWMDKLSPFGYVPQLPVADFTAVPLVLLTVVAAALVALGLAGFRRRDLEAV